MAEAKRDQNSIPALIGVSSADGVTPVVVYVDPTTHRLLVDIAGGSGTVTSVSVVTANGISGSVATATTTPAITLTLGVITPTSVNGLTLAAQAIGFTIAGGTTSKTLTVPLDASVSGTNTGDSATPAETAITIGALIGGAGDATPNDTDFVATALTAGGVLQKITWANVKTFLKTYFDSVAQTLTNKTLNSNTNYIDADATHAKVFLALGRAGVVGDVVYISAWNVANSCPEVSLAKANATATLPVSGVLESAGADGTVQSMRIEGVLNNVNTNTWSAGTRLYVSAATAGLLTSTRPTTPNFDQAVATVVFQNATTGILDVIRTAYVGTMAYEDTASYVAKSLFDAQTILQATTDNTPVALTVGEQTVVGRATGGNITALAIDSDLSSVSANDDTVPSAKATKAMGDLKLPLAGGTMTGPIVQGSYINLSSPASDHTATGLTTNAFQSGATVAAFELVFMGSSSKWLLVDADAVATCKGLLAIALEAKNDTQAMLVALPGTLVRDDTWNWTIGATLYAGETPGTMQEAIPTGADAIIKVVGFAMTADVIFFNPSPDQQSTVA